MKRTELETFFTMWDMEAEKVAKLMEALPANQYEFRPTPEYRSLGEMAWHLAEIDAYTSTGIMNKKLDFNVKLPGLERPREVAALASGYRRVHREAVARMQTLALEDLDRDITFFDGRQIPTRVVLWDAMFHHMIHHRAQLSLICRMAKGKPPGMYGPNHEELMAMREAMKQR